MLVLVLALVATSMSALAGPIDPSTTTTSQPGVVAPGAPEQESSPPTTVPATAPRGRQPTPIPNQRGPEPGLPASPPRTPLDSGGEPALLSSSYQSDTMWFDGGSGNGIYNVDVEVFIYERNRCDTDTCTNGQRNLSGYVWFIALGSYLGNLQGECRGYLHGGIGRGNGISSNWFLDWSGYNNVPACGSGSSLGPGLGHGTQLFKERWYRLRMWRLSWNGQTGCWGFWILDKSTNVETYAGQWCMAGAYQLIGDQHQFVEIAETNPCTTDVWGVHAQKPQYRDLTAGVKSYPDGYVTYEATCLNTYDRSINDSIPYWIDDRETTRLNDPDGDLFNWEW